MDFSVLEQRIASASLKLLANVTVTPGAGESFRGCLDTADNVVFEVARATTHVLHYDSPSAVASGAVLTIAGGVYAGVYKVVEPPRRVDGYGFTVELCRQ